MGSFDAGSTREYSCRNSLQLLILSYQSLNDKRLYVGNLHSQPRKRRKPAQQNPEHVQSEEVFEGLFGITSLKQQMLLFLIQRNDASTR